jgi:hypothetical protein
VGGPAARAWGMEGLCNLKPVPFFRSVRCAREQQNVIQEQSGPNLFTPEAATNSRLQLRFCAPRHFASIAQPVQSSQYFPVSLGDSF